MKLNPENKDEILERIIDLEKKVSIIDQKLNSNTSIKNDNQKKYEMNLTSGNINFLKILSIIVLAFFIAYWSLRIINN
tara:strand:- start:716 stop:949 length:234 start_codon:yes stop_codon:yes gene_type:complete